MPRKKSDLNNTCTRNARRTRARRAQQSDEQIAARNAAQRIRIAEIRRQESREQHDERLQRARSRTARKRQAAKFRERGRERQQTSCTLTDLDICAAQEIIKIEIKEEALEECVNWLEVIDRPELITLQVIENEVGDEENKDGRRKGSSDNPELVNHYKKHNNTSQITASTKNPDKCNEKSLKKAYKIMSSPSFNNHQEKNSMESNDKIVVEVDHRHCSQISGSITTTNNIRAATTAEPSRAYIARKKSETQAASDLSSIHYQHPESTHHMQERRAQKKKDFFVANGGFLIQRKRRKTDAERAKEYRARKKAKNQTEDLMDSTDKIVVDVDVHHRHCSQISGSITTTNNICAATTAELSRAYRAWSDGFPIQRKRRKTDAERAKEYRARKKSKIQTEANDIRNVPDPIQYLYLGNNQCSNSSDNQYRNLRDNQTIREQIQEHRGLKITTPGTPAIMQEIVKIEIKQEPLEECVDSLDITYKPIKSEQIKNELDEDDHFAEMNGICYSPAAVDRQEYSVTSTPMFTENEDMTPTIKHVQDCKVESEIFGDIVAKKISKYSSELLSAVKDDIMKILVRADKINHS